MIMHSALIQFCRMVILITFLLAVWGKGRDLTATEQSVRVFMPGMRRYSRFAALLLVFAESLVVLLLLVGGTGMLVGFLFASSILVMFTFGIISVLKRDVATPCNCFGADQRNVATVDVYRNAGFIVLGALGFAVALAGQTVPLPWWYWSLIVPIAVVFVLIWSNLGQFVELTHNTFRA